MLEEYLRPYLAEFLPWLLIKFSRVELWAWLALPVLLVAAFFVAAIGVRMVTGGVHWTIRRKHEAFYQRYITPMIAPLILWAAMMLFTASIHLLPLGERWTKNVSYFSGTLITYAIVWGLFRLINHGGEALRQQFIHRDKPSAAALIPLMRKLLKTILAAMAVLFLLQNWGFDVMALVAGLGIGGVALALASQKSVENIFGGISVTLDQPVRVGDLIDYGTNKGTVEDIGLRSTTIRTLNRTLVSIPNTQFSEMKLENYAARDKMLIKKVIGVRYETSPDKIRRIIQRVEEYFASRDDVGEGGRMRFIDFGASSLDLEIYAYVLTKDFPDFLLKQQEILLKIMDIIAEEKSDFAFPSTTLYLERGSGLEK